MKIIMFRYNADSSAIIKNSNLSQLTDWHQQKTTNSILAGGYEDRFLWEEVTSQRRHREQPFIIVGHWQ